MFTSMKELEDLRLKVMMNVGHLNLTDLLKIEKLMRSNDTQVGIFTIVEIMIKNLMKFVDIGDFVGINLVISSK